MFIFRSESETLVVGDSSYNEVELDMWPDEDNKLEF